ncbi:beta-1,2-xylosyltransferase XYXT1-like [Zingiber officinale]|uniref:beta-1,2-xylosyltransferase XYXT1-like n=1 Tax=Zingiber officinale TaxID=94328 RepID=UPI001C4C48AC|nr:beta-1,2-xylosyltransferase XYXT1-like [Zingiber officinale]
MKKRMEASKLALRLLLGVSLAALTCFLAVSVFSVDQQLSLFYGAWTNPPISSGGDDREGTAGGSTQGVATAAQSGESPSSSIDLIMERRKGEDGGGGDREVVNPGAVSVFQSNQKSTSAKGNATNQQLEQKRKERKGIGEESICDFSDWRSDVCEMAGDVRIHGNSSAVVVVGSEAEEEAWRIKPYARKFDKSAMQHIKEVTVRSAGAGAVVQACTVNQTSVPALVFAIGGYAGNYYHDYTDVLIPLFITARQFDGDVQFVISTSKFWWVDKYKPILKQLSRHEIVYLDGDGEVRCHRRVIVGLRSHKPMSIDPARTPGGYSMLDFTKLMRVAYGLERDRPARRAAEPPRLLLIPRKGSRRFTNLEEVVSAAEAAGFEVVLAEAATTTRLAEFVRVVNSCDAMVGVHGAGLTNFVYLPTGAAVVQIIPFGNLEKISRSCFMNSSEDAGLRYLDYSIGPAESSLSAQYPRDDPVFTDPKSIHRLGWKKMGEVYLDHQDVKIDVGRFRPLLLQAREHLRRYTIEV